MHYIIFDLEATCWKDRNLPKRKEIIEIGAVKLNRRFEEVDEFSRFVRPVREPRLSGFCMELTSIRQEQVDSAPRFDRVLEEFLAWAGPGPVTFCSWGYYDLNQLRIDCTRFGLGFPEILNNHVNLKVLFAEWKGTRRCGMAKALQILGLDLVGTHHRGIDDARNIARIARRMLPEVHLSIHRIPPTSTEPTPGDGE